MTKTILRSTRKKPKINGGGYDRRSLQIAELVELAKFKIVDVEKTSKNRISRYINGFPFLLKHYQEINSLYRHFHGIDWLHSYRILRLCGEEIENHQNAFKKNIDTKLLLWEATEKQVPAYIAKKAHFKVIAVPHNLESLVINLDNPYEIQPILRRFKNEVKQLAKVDAVFCISREEQWLLNLFGIRADCLPYYPPKQIITELYKIKEARQNLNQKRFLILGSANNPPTFLGMVKQLECLQETGQNIEVDIAGYSTEKLEPYCKNSNFTLHGTVDKSELNNLLTNAKAVLIYQEAGVGALTRIPEMLIAGIPVIANSNACRSAFGYSGLYSYDSDQELSELIAEQLDIPGILPRPVEAEKRFIDCLKELLK